MIVDIKLALWNFGIHVTGVANIDIKPSVAVDVNHHHSGAPLLLFGYTRLVGDIFKLPISFIKVKFVAAHVCREENVGQSIVINVANGNASAIIEITVAEYIEVFGVVDGIREFHSSAFHQLKQGIACRLLCLATREKKYEKD